MMDNKQLFKLALTILALTCSYQITVESQEIDIYIQCTQPSWLTANFGGKLCRWMTGGNEYPDDYPFPINDSFNSNFTCLNSTFSLTLLSGTLPTTFYCNRSLGIWILKKELQSYSNLGGLNVSINKLQLTNQNGNYRYNFENNRWHNKTAYFLCGMDTTNQQYYTKYLDCDNMTDSYFYRRINLTVPSTTNSITSKPLQTNSIPFYTNTTTPLSAIANTTTIIQQNFTSFIWNNNYSTTTYNNSISTTPPVTSTLSYTKNISTIASTTTIIQQNSTPFIWSSNIFTATYNNMRTASPVTSTLSYATNISTIKLTSTMTQNLTNITTTIKSNLTSTDTTTKAMAQQNSTTTKLVNSTTMNKNTATMQTSTSTTYKSNATNSTQQINQTTNSPVHSTLFYNKNSSTINIASTVVHNNNTISLTTVFRQNSNYTNTATNVTISTSFSNITRINTATTILSMTPQNSATSKLVNFTNLNSITINNNSTTTIQTLASITYKSNVTNTTQHINKNQTTEEPRWYTKVCILQRSRRHLTNSSIVEVVNITIKNLKLCDSLDPTYKNTEIKRYNAKVSEQITDIKKKTEMRVDNLAKTSAVTKSLSTSFAGFAIICLIVFIGIVLLIDLPKFLSFLRKLKNKLRTKVKISVKNKPEINRQNNIELIMMKVRKADQEIHSRIKLHTKKTNYRPSSGGNNIKKY